MNLRLGRFGLQESACTVGVSALILGVFAVNVGDTFAAGNVCYPATAAGALLALLLLRLLQGAMVRCVFCGAAIPRDSLFCPRCGKKR